MLEKKRVLRKIEFILTDDKINPSVHCLYNDIILEDGNILQKVNHRENMSVEDALSLLNKAEKYEPPIVE